MVERQVAGYGSGFGRQTMDIDRTAVPGFYSVLHGILWLLKVGVTAQELLPLR